MLPSGTTSHIAVARRISLSDGRFATLVPPHSNETISCILPKSAPRSYKSSAVDSVERHKDVAIIALRLKRNA
jgi:hypothetical protein